MVKPYYPPSAAHDRPYLRETHTEEVAASFLLSLKHSRSVTPEPLWDDSPEGLGPKAPYQSYSSSIPTYGRPHAIPSASPQLSAPENVPSTPAMTPVAVPAPDLSDLPSFESLIADSKLVQMKDRDLVPDSLFVAMAQMKPCRLTPQDRVGCYKTREIGFLGMSCKHCGGLPGFGRYYPNSVRSLAQTTTSQTILKHIGSKCRLCPPHIRDAVVKLQQQFNACEGTSSGRPRYGSRKIFFQRVWSRLHEDGFEGEEGKQVSDDISTQTPDMDETSYASEDEVSTQKRKGRFPQLPTKRLKA